MKYYDKVIITCSKEHHCNDLTTEAIFYPQDDGYVIFELQKTYREINERLKFPLEPGCLISCYFGEYTIIDVIYKNNRPRFAVCKTIKSSKLFIEL